MFGGGGLDRCDGIGINPSLFYFLRDAKSGRASFDMLPSSCDATPGVCLRARLCLKVLDEYVKLFDMRAKTFVEALRAFLKEFRLPGEVSKMPRVLFCARGWVWCSCLGR